MDSEGDLLSLFPAEKRRFWEKAAGLRDRIQEIRIRVEKPVILSLSGAEYFLDSGGEFVRRPENAFRMTRAEAEQQLNHLCNYSLYAYEDEFRQGFLSVAGGHRVGITGQVIRDGEGGIRTIRNISGMNIRISHEIKGAADSVLPCLYRKDRLLNVLIISPPGCGKTTLLRDLIRQVSDGNRWGSGRCVGVVDERSEIAGSCGGIPQNDVGIRTDVLDGCPKTQGMMLLLRSMSPQVLAIDELGGDEDLKALRMASYCGVGVLATAHGEDIRDVAQRFRRTDLLEEGIFDLFLIMGCVNGRPAVKRIVEKEEAYASISGRDHDTGRLHGAGVLVSETISAASQISADTSWDT